MPRWGSIGRWMIVIALIGLNLALARAWLGPHNILREFGPMAIVAVVGVLIGLQAKGRWRQFGFGMAVAGLATSVVLFRASWNSRLELSTRVIRPIERLLPSKLPTVAAFYTETEPGQGLPVTEFPDLWEELSADEVYFPFPGVQEQVVLGLVELPIALAGGLIAAVRWRKSKPEIESPRVDRP